MEIIVNKIYKSHDNKEFNSEEDCLLYESMFLTDAKLIECFHFFS